MTESELIAAASGNLRQTYISLGLAVPETQAVSDECFEGCIGPMDHPVCNFALNLNLDPWAVGRLRDLARWGEGFNVYSLPDDRPVHRAELLERQKFRLNYRLVMMVADPDDPGAFPDLLQASTFRDRLQVAEFMAAQFPGRQSAAYRSEIAQATTRAEDLELYEFTERNQRTAAVMVSRSCGVLGIYNLCVAAGKRGRGIGTALLAWVRATARNAGMPVSLQCDQTLASWYELSGFRRIGFVDVYSLDKTEWPDIMV